MTTPDGYRCRQVGEELICDGYHDPFNWAEMLFVAVVGFIVILVLFAGWALINQKMKAHEDRHHDQGYMR